MEKIYSLLRKEFKNNSGSVLGIGIMDQKLIDIIDQNSKITFCDLLNDPKVKKEKTKRKLFNFTKRVSPKALRKRYKKKSIDYVICSYELINPYIKYFIKDSIYITNKEVYLYAKKDEIDLELIKKRYSRYNVEIDIQEYKIDTLITIKTNKAKNYFFKDKLYFITDSLYNFIELISNYLLK